LVARCMSLLVWIGSLERALRGCCGVCASNDAGWGRAPAVAGVALWRDAGDAVFETGALRAGVLLSCLPEGCSGWIESGWVDSLGAVGGCAASPPAGACCATGSGATPAASAGSAAAGATSPSAATSCSAVADAVAARVARSPAGAAALPRSAFAPRALVDFADGERVATLSPRFQNFDRRQLFALEELEERATARRNVADLVVDAVLGDRRERIAAACDRECR
jgi:hypothetical protein